MLQKWKEEWQQRYREEGGSYSYASAGDADFLLFVQVKLREDIYEAINENTETLRGVRQELSVLNENFSDLIMQLSEIKEILQSKL